MHFSHNYFFRIKDNIPGNLTDVAKGIFKMVVCFKPRMVRGGLFLYNKAKGENSTKNVMADMEDLLGYGKAYKLNVLKPQLLHLARVIISIIFNMALKLSCLN